MPAERTQSRKNPRPGPPTRCAPVIDRAPLPVLEVQGSAHIVSSVNSAFCDLTGKSKAELLGNSFPEIVSGGEECMPILDRAYKSETAASQAQADEPSCLLHAMWPTLDARRRPVEVVIQVAKDAIFPQSDTAVNESLLIAGLRQHELTETAENLNTQLRAEIVERKKSEAALGRAIDELENAKDAAEQGSRAKDNFLAALSHELRTPLTPVLLTAAALREDERLPMDAREQLGMMQRNIALEARLIDDLLDLTKISLGKLEFQPQPCDAHHLIDFAFDIVREDALGKQITLERSFTARHSGLMADPTRFQQVIWNLLRNAVKFTPRGGRISIRTREEKNAQGETWLRIEVADSGIGIDPARIEQIFLPFDQGGLTGDHRFGGVGLGLAIARAVVDMHGGRINALSAGANCGTTFVVELPGAIEPQSGVIGTASPSGATATLRAIAPLRLLLVEDHVSTLQTLQRLIARDGHHVVTATNVADALDAAASNEFDLVISDLGLPDGLGTELMEKLRTMYGLRGIALSGYGMEEDLARSRDAGFLTHLIKPIVIDELRRAIASLAPVH